MEQGAYLLSGPYIIIDEGMYDITLLFLLIVKMDIRLDM